MCETQCHVQQTRTTPDAVCCAACITGTKHTTPHDNTVRWWLQQGRRQPTAPLWPRHTRHRASSSCCPSTAAAALLQLCVTQHRQLPNTGRHGGAPPRPCERCCQACVISSAVNSCTRMVPCPTAHSTNPVSALVPRTRVSQQSKSQTAVPWLQLSRCPTPQPLVQNGAEANNPLKRTEKRPCCHTDPYTPPRQQTQQIKCHASDATPHKPFQHTIYDASCSSCWHPFRATEHLYLPLTNTYSRACKLTLMPQPAAWGALLAATAVNLLLQARHSPRCCACWV